MNRPLALAVMALWCTAAAPSDNKRARGRGGQAGTPAAGPGRPDDAEAVLNKALDEYYRAPDIGPFIDKLAVVLRRQGRAEKVTTELAARAKPSYRDLALLVALYNDAGDYDGALKACETMLARADADGIAADDPNRSSLYTYAAFAGFALGKNERAQKYAAEALRIRRKRIVDAPRENTLMNANHGFSALLAKDAKKARFWFGAAAADFAAIERGRPNERTVARALKELEKQSNE